MYTYKLIYIYILISSFDVDTCFGIANIYVYTQLSRAIFIPSTLLCICRPTTCIHVSVLSFYIYIHTYTYTYKHVVVYTYMFVKNEPCMCACTYTHTQANGQLHPMEGARPEA